MDQNIVPTNQEYAEILKGVLNNLVLPRGYNKNILPFSRVNYAFTKAIELLEKTSDYDA